MAEDHAIRFEASVKSDIHDVLTTFRYDRDVDSATLGRRSRSAYAFFGLEDYRHREPAKTAVLMVNLGTPQAPTARALRPYLRQFLSDPRVIEVPRLIWQLILNLVILPLRPRRSAAAYREIWTEDGSPLATGTAGLAEAVDAEVEPDVWWAMRYGEPAVEAVVRDLLQKNYRRVFVLPLYPQYSATTTASVFDALADALKRVRWLPDLRFLTCYHDHPLYLDAIAASLRTRAATHGPADRLLFSFHGLPRDYLERGDPYYCQCQRTAREVATRLGLGEDDYAVSFQSRVGRAVWLKPYTEGLLIDWARSGVRNVRVVCPGFAVDCLETLEEIALRARDEFIEAGGEVFDYAPCLNDDPAHIDLLAQLIKRETANWPVLENAPAERADRAASARATLFEE